MVIDQIVYKEVTKAEAICRLLLADGKDPVQQSSSHHLYANMVNQSGVVSSVPMPPLNLLQSSIKVHLYIFFMCVQELWP
jgi:hypothetical protein